MTTDNNLIGNLYTLSYNNVVQVKILVDHQAYIAIRENKELKDDEYKRELKKLTKGYEFLTTNSDWYKGIPLEIDMFHHYGGVSVFTIKQQANECIQNKGL